MNILNAYKQMKVEELQLSILNAAMVSSHIGGGAFAFLMGSSPLISAGIMGIVSLIWLVIYGITFYRLSKTREQSTSVNNGATQEALILSGLSLVRLIVQRLEKRSS